MRRNGTRSHAFPRVCPRGDHGELKGETPITSRALDLVPLVNIDIDCLQIPIFFRKIVTIELLPVRAAILVSYRFDTHPRRPPAKQKAFDLDDLTEK